MKKILTVLLLVAGIVLSSCSSRMHGEEAVKLKSGDYLKYTISMPGLSANKKFMTVRFMETGQNEYTVEMTGDELNIPEIPFDYNKKVKVNNKLTSNGVILSLNPLGQMWIPSEYREKGLVVPGLGRINKTGVYDEKTVMIIETKDDKWRYQRIYDLATGILLKSSKITRGGGVAVILTETNIRGL